MQFETSKMIYAQESVAQAIAAKLEQVRGKKFAVYKVTTGFQVCPVTVCKAYVPPAKPLPVQKPSFESEEVTGDVMVFTFKLQKESPKYISVYKPDGSLMHLGKSTLIGWDISINEGESTPTVKVKMTNKVAKKRGLI